MYNGLMNLERKDRPINIIFLYFHSCVMHIYKICCISFSVLIKPLKSPSQDSIRKRRINKSTKDLMSISQLSLRSAVSQVTILCDVYSVHLSSNTNL